MKLGAKELRVTKPTPEQFKKIRKNPIYIVLDDVLDTYNIGAIFRLADAVAAEKVILCKGSETPPHTRIKKASINTTEWVKWEYYDTALEAVKKLRSDVPGIQIVSIEQDKMSVDFQKAEYKFPVAFVVGHESDGVSKEVLDESDLIVELPMHGVNISLNVMVSLGIVLYESQKSLPQS
jgi:23S rRNA (guanosine2251-2'-O)-methyltransferase